MEIIWIDMEDIGKLHPLVTSENDTEDLWFPVLNDLHMDTHGSFPFVIYVIYAISYRRAILWTHFIKALM